MGIKPFFLNSRLKPLAVRNSGVRLAVITAQRRSYPVEVLMAKAIKARGRYSRGQRTVEEDDLVIVMGWAIESVTFSPSARSNPIFYGQLGVWEINSHKVHV